MKKHILYYQLLIILLVLTFLALHFVFKIKADAEPWAMLVLTTLVVMVFYFITKRRKALSYE